MCLLSHLQARVILTSEDELTPSNVRATFNARKVQYVRSLLRKFIYRAREGENGYA